MNTLLVLVVLAVTLTATNGLKCYTCDGNTNVGQNEDCGDEYTKDPAMLLSCASTETFCRKEKSGINNVLTKVKRGCAAQCEEQNVAYLKVVKCCQGDGCNSAGAVSATMGLIIASIAAAFSL